MISFKKYCNLLCEGGAGGHMAHPFDLPSINTGKQLLKLFERVGRHLEKTPGAVKVDGVNAAVKLIETEDGGRVFAMDRGSMKQIDVDGITIDRLAERFPPKINAETGEETAHGMINAGNTVLTILNNSIPYVEKELKKLRMWNNSNILLNLEFVEAGGTNVVTYDNNFLAFHGILKSSLKATGKSRQQKESAYNEEAFNSFVHKVSHVAKEHGFEVYGSIPTRITNIIDFTEALQEQVTLQLTADIAHTKSLMQWLSESRNPHNAKVRTADGRNIQALAKEVYTYLIDEPGGPLEDYIPDKSHAKLAIGGAIFWHATRQLGNVILNNSTSPVGNVGEGIVVRGLGDIPFKITGDFIVQGMQSKFQQVV